MVKLRLTRTGKKHQPHYRIVAVDSRKKRDGRFIDILGYYNPRTKPSTVKLDKELVEKWLSQGAQPSETVASILKKEGFLKKAAPAKKEKTTKEAGKETKAKKAPATKKAATKKTTTKKASTAKKK